MLEFFGARPGSIAVDSSSVLGFATMEKPSSGLRREIWRSIYQKKNPFGCRFANEVDLSCLNGQLQVLLVPQSRYFFV